MRNQRNIGVVLLSYALAISVTALSIVYVVGLIIGEPIR